MTTRKSLFLAAILGLIALLIGATLLYIGREPSEREQAETVYQPEYVDGAAMVRFVETLSSDALEGRATGTTGNEAARGFILKRFETLGLRPVTDSFAQTFPIVPGPRSGEAEQGVNVVGWIPGKTPGSGPVLILTAHYDHLGIVDGEIYNGADDNASGVSALIAIAHRLTETTPEHDIVFAALDGEEIGFLGARALLRALRGGDGLALDRIAMNINLDMVSRSEVGELHVAGTYHTPELSEIVVDGVIANAPVTLIKSHDRPELGKDDWSRQSDHAVFLDEGIPFLYFGVEDHAGYHTPEDDADQITVDFYTRAADTIAMAVLASDQALDDILELRN